MVVVVVAVVNCVSCAGYVVCRAFYANLFLSKIFFGELISDTLT